MGEVLMGMENIKKKLKELFPEGEWVIKDPPAGLSAKAFVADNGHKKVFIKNDVRSHFMKRLSELGVTPEVFYEGVNEGKPYIIQEFIDGKHPEQSWFAKNLEELARLISKYQNDKELRQILLAESPQSYAELMEKDLAWLEQEVGSYQSELFQTAEIKTGVEKIKQDSKDLKPVTLVPTHSDPNISNFLLTEKGLTFVDWDDMGLSDPMRDVAMILWWFIPKTKWPEFFKLYGQEMDEDKIYWWIAKHTIQVATWFDKRGDVDNAKFFVNDFMGALQRKDNSLIYSVAA